MSMEKIVIIVTFIALLEMIKNGMVRVYQNGKYNDLLFTR
jgi:chromatin segregation and condensation protein Rec8/ScpA/Scc1 (kleisin family)